MIIGIPRAGMFYMFYPFWKEFFSVLGQEICLSPKTDKSILNLGLNAANSESCLPIKLLYGHINWLKQKGINDFLLPEMDEVISTNSVFGNKSFFCPYFVALPDFMKAEYPEINILRPKISITDNLIEKEPWIKLALTLGKNDQEAGEAFSQAQNKFIDFQKQLRNKNISDNEVFDLVENKGDRTIAVIGHPYVVYYSYLNLNILRKIIDKGFAVKTMEMFSEEEKNEGNKIIQVECHNHWNITNEERLGVMSAACDKSINGIIYITPFNCGPDFLMETYALKTARKIKPVTSISIDESSGEAGLNTRIEAFIDVLK